MDASGFQAQVKLFEDRTALGAGPVDMLASSGGAVTALAGQPEAFAAKLREVLDQR